MPYVHEPSFASFARMRPGLLQLFFSRPFFASNHAHWAFDDDWLALTTFVLAGLLLLSFSSVSTTNPIPDLSCARPRKVSFALRRVVTLRLTPFFVTVFVVVVVRPTRWLANGFWIVAAGGTPSPTAMRAAAGALAAPWRST